MVVFMSDITLSCIIIITLLLVLLLLFTGFFSLLLPWVLFIDCYVVVLVLYLS